MSKQLKRLHVTADTGCTIVCITHQPSTEIFEAFDEMLLMKKGGQLIYAGSLGHFSQNMIQYFEAISGVPKIQEGQNPAAWMLDITSPAMEHKLGIDFRTVFQNSPLYRNNMELVDELNYRPSNSEDLNFELKHTTCFQKQCLYCLWKQHRSYWKNPEYNIVRFIITISISVLFGLVFLGIGSKMSNEQDIFNILGALYGSAMFIGFANANIVQPIVEIERTVLP